jgi:long-chain acyl-CoA synthetase
MQHRIGCSAQAPAAELWWLWPTTAGTAAGSVGGVNAAATLVATAARLGENTALKLDDVEWSYRALDAASARVAALLRGRGVVPGDRVAVMLPNVPELVVVYYGILRAGGAVVPMDVLLEEPEVAVYLCDSGAKLLFAWHALAEVVEVGAARAATECLFVTPGEFGWLLGSVRPDRDLCERDGEDTAVILYAPGASGAPQGTELTHASLGCRADRLRRAQALAADDVALGTSPLVHSFAQAGALNATIGAGGCLSMIARFDAGKALQVIARDRVTVLQGEPATYAALLNHPDRDRCDVSTLRVCVCGAPLPAELLRGLEQGFGCKVVEDL